MRALLRPPGSRLRQISSVRRLPVRHADYAAELEAKRQKVADALQRIGGSISPFP